MSKKIFLAAFFVAAFMGQVFSQNATTIEPKEKIIKGIIKEIAADGSFVLVNDTKIFTTKQFLEEAYLEVGDNVEITVAQSSSGLTAEDYNYIFDEEEAATAPSSEEAPAAQADPVAQPVPVVAPAAPVPAAVPAPVTVNATAKPSKK
jgi:hypothetical protein